MAAKRWHATNAELMGCQYQPSVSSSERQIGGEVQKQEARSKRQEARSKKQVASSKKQTEDGEEGGREAQRLKGSGVSARRAPVSLDTSLYRLPRAQFLFSCA